MSAALFDDSDPAGAHAESPVAEAPADAPLAERVRPRRAEEVFGQSHLLGEGKLLQRVLDVKCGIHPTARLWSRIL